MPQFVTLAVQGLVLLYILHRARAMTYLHETWQDRYEIREMCERYRLNDFLGDPLHKVLFDNHLQALRNGRDPFELYPPWVREHLTKYRAGELEPPQ